MGSITTARPNTYKTKKGDSHDNSPLAGVSFSFVGYFNIFSNLFQTKTRNCADQGALYLKGLVQAEKKNMERMAEMVPESNEQALQHFVSNSPWDANAVMDQVAMRSNEALQDGEEPSPHEWHLIFRKEIDGGKLKYTLSNAPADTSVERLAFAQAQRYWVERAFQESKQHSGLDDYQVRGWLAWHHHMALVMMAMQFMLEEKLKHQDLYPLLSCADIVSLLKYALPKRAVTQEEILRQMEIRHKKRKSAIESARKT